MNEITMAEPKVTEMSRRTILSLVFQLIALHPAAKLTFEQGGHNSSCAVCRRVAEAMAYLDDDQRRYGPAFELERTDRDA